MWIVIGFVLLAVVGVVVVIFMCIVINKKRVIRRGSSEAIFDYDDSERFLFLGFIPCCCRRHKKTGIVTQASLESYRKTPLPPIGGGKLDHAGPSTAPELRSPRSRLEPLAPAHLHKTADAHAAYLRNIPVIPIAEKDYRPLPILNRQPAFPS
ncbi:hypothetical protein AAVH_12578 [Aphelenchoides avenae]|nr:hypothetical protein AAVH_12578 [Aphelenchus avenae]